MLISLCVFVAVFISQNLVDKFSLIQEFKIDNNLQRVPIDQW